jgi:hypothetical protein
MKKLIILASVLALTAVGFAGQVSAQGVGLSIDVETITPKTFDDDKKDNGGTNVYSAKFVCGTITGTGQIPVAGSPLVPGTYLTAINVHVPQNDSLDADQGFEIDCGEIADLLGKPSGFDPADPFVKGFVVIYSKADLDVVAAYSVKNVEEEAIGEPGEPGLCFNAFDQVCDPNRVCDSSLPIPQPPCTSNEFCNTACLP